MKKILTSEEFAKEYEPKQKPKTKKKMKLEVLALILGIVGAYSVLKGTYILIGTFLCLVSLGIYIYVGIKKKRSHKNNKA
jgi:hypothetical protein